MADRDRSRSRSPGRNDDYRRGDSGNNGGGEEVKLYIGNLDYGAYGD
jgi:hypothetical protein